MSHSLFWVFQRERKKTYLCKNRYQCEVLYELYEVLTVLIYTGLSFGDVYLYFPCALFCYVSSP